LGEDASRQSRLCFLLGAPLDELDDEEGNTRPPTARMAPSRLETARWSGSVWVSPRRRPLGSLVPLTPGRCGQG
jgi:hypothetical protein